RRPGGRDRCEGADESHAGAGRSPRTTGATPRRVGDRPPGGLVLANPVGFPSVTRAWVAAQDAAAHTFVAALDDTLVIAGADGHHLQRVRRLRIGEHVTAADGAGNWRRYEIDAIEPGRLRLSA